MSLNDIRMLSRGDRITNLLVLRTANLHFFFYRLHIDNIICMRLLPNIPFTRSSNLKIFLHDFQYLIMTKLMMHFFQRDNYLRIATCATSSEVKESFASRDVLVAWL